MPWPEITDFSGGVAKSAVSSQLDDLVVTALKLLHARGGVAQGRRVDDVKRLGLAAFSRGGDAMWQALRAAHRGGRSRIREVYSFDATGFAGQSADLFGFCAMQSGELVLRVVDATDSGAAFGRIVTGINLFKEQHHASFSFVAKIHPDLQAFPHFYDVPPSSDASRWWQHYIKHEPFTDPAWRNVRDKQSRMTRMRSDLHQFAICGGESSTSGETFLGMFLKASSF